MNNYDFKSLNDKEFEALACELLSEKEKVRFERFKPGRDQGVDGRFFRNGNEVILQCKHYANLNQLIGALQAKEQAKVEALKPSRYMLAVSNPLSRQDKKVVARIFAPYLHESDVYGAEDLNQLLGEYPYIEKRHYKLWLHSSEVLSTLLNHAILGRSASSLDEIQETASRYAVTENHERALDHLRNRRVIIITGEPGIGKTTLAGHLCIAAVAEGYEFVEIADDLKEAESVYLPEVKQVFYFDDFLGRNYLEALEGHEGKHITQFIRRVAKDPDKLFVLTSRSTILNQGKLLIDLFAHEKIEKNEYELRISSLSRLDKARILYNHLYHSGMTDEYRDQIYSEYRYIEIINHRNFNPRLISYITDPARFESVPVTEYKNFIQASLSDPSAIWNHPFVAQQDDFGRALTLLVVLYRRPVPEQQLSYTYKNFISLPFNQNMKGRREFVDTLRSLTGSLLNRQVSKEGEILVDLFNPSIGDYVLSRYAKDIGVLVAAFECMEIDDALQTIKSLHKAKIVSVEMARTVAESILFKVAEIGWDNFKIAKSAEVLTFNIRLGSSKPKILGKMKELTRHIYENATGRDDLGECFTAIEWALTKDYCKPESALRFIERLHSSLSSELEVSGCYSLLNQIDDTVPGKGERLHEVNESIESVISDSLADFIDLTDIYADCDPQDYDHLHELFKRRMKNFLSELGVPPDLMDLDQLIYDHDLDSELDNYYQDGFSSDFHPKSVAQNDVDDIHDLFCRD